MYKVLTDQQVSNFNKDGFLLISNFYSSDEILPIQKGIYDIIGHVMIKNGVLDTRTPFTPETFDDGYLELIKRNRKWGSEVYDAIKQIPAFLRLVANPLHEKVLAQIRPGAFPGVAAGGYGIRIDNPNEDKYRAMWHQDYLSQLRSIDGLVFWSPLMTISEDLGPVTFCKGSHLDGARPVCESDPELVGRSGAYALQLYNESEVITKYKQCAPLTNPCDVVIIDFLVLHASGYNRGNRSRFSMQTRYFNFTEKIGRAHAWKGSFASGIDFREIHPHLFIHSRES